MEKITSVTTARPWELDPEVRGFPNNEDIERKAREVYLAGQAAIRQERALRGATGTTEINVSENNESAPDSTI